MSSGLRAESSLSKRADFSLNGLIRASFLSMAEVQDAAERATINAGGLSRLNSMDEMNAALPDNSSQIAYFLTHGPMTPEWDLASSRLSTW
jgi:hypothetical protein